MGQLDASFNSVRPDLREPWANIAGKGGHFHLGRTHDLPPVTEREPAFLPERFLTDRQSFGLRSIFGFGVTHVSLYD